MSSIPHPGVLAVEMAGCAPPVYLPLPDDERRAPGALGEILACVDQGLAIGPAPWERCGTGCPWGPMAGCTGSGGTAATAGRIPRHTMRNDAS